MNYKYNLHSIGTENRLYVLKCGKGFSCYGFDVIAKKLERFKTVFEIKDYPIGSPEMYYEYMQLIEQLRNTGKRYDFELNPRLIGLEGKRIECVMYGEKTRFIVGRSTGFIPIHLEIKTRRSSGGDGIPYDAPISNIKVLN